MYTKRLHYLLPKLPLKTLIMTLVVSTFLSACGIKGDLYQTPEAPVSEKEVVTSEANKTPQNTTEKIELETPNPVQKPREQITNKPAVPAIESADKTVKEL